MTTPQPTPTTRAVRAGISTDPAHGAVVPPVYLSSTFAFAELGRSRGYDYTRTANPTRNLLGSTLADLEAGAAAVVTSTGMSAVAVALELVPAGGLVVAAHDCYGGTWRLLQAWAAKRRFEVRFVDLTDATATAAALAARPHLVWVETPSNPLLRITDIADVTARAHQVGAMVVVDNTFCSPAVQQPLLLGADVVVHSTTKYLNGHSDVVGGALVAADAEVGAQLGWWANCLGVTGAPFDAYLTLRGVRTLDARMRIHQANAAAVAEALAEHPLVAAVHWPGLASHPGHEVARRQQRGFGAMVSFELAAPAEGLGAFCRRLRCFTLAESLGGVESLIAHPATMTHAAMSAEARRRAGITDTLLRLSVGIEDAADLVGDLLGALEAVATSVVDGTTVDAKATA